MFGGPWDLWGVGEEPTMVVLGCCGRGWAALGLAQLQEPVLEVVSEVRRFAASCWLLAGAPIKACGSQPMEEAH